MWENMKDTITEFFFFSEIDSLSGFINFIPKWVTNRSGSILKAIK